MFKQWFESLQDLHLTGDTGGRRGLPLDDRHPQRSLVTWHQTLQVLQQQLQEKHQGLSEAVTTQSETFRTAWLFWHVVYRNDPKFSDTQKICCNHSKVWTMWLYHRVMSPNDADRMANSVDPDQTAPLGAVWSGSALFAQAYLSENLGSLR